MSTNEIFGNHIHPASLTSQINDLITSGALPPNFISQSPTLLFDKARGQLMTTLNMHPAEGQAFAANGLLAALPITDQASIPLIAASQALEALDSAN